MTSVRTSSHARIPHRTQFIVIAEMIDVISRVICVQARVCVLYLDVMTAALHAVCEMRNRSENVDDCNSQVRRRSGCSDIGCNVVNTCMLPGPGARRPTNGVTTGGSGGSKNSGKEYDD